MVKPIAWISALAALFAMAGVPAHAEYTLHILHMNDWHSRIESINAFDSTCARADEDAGNCFGGAARLLTAIHLKRAEYAGGNVLFLNAGDNFQGSLFYNTYKGAVEAEFLRLMRPDALSLGNHEFDDGEEQLAGFLGKVDFPVLAANVLPGVASRLGDRIRPSVTIDAGGEKIGIVGAVTNDTDMISSPGDEVLIVNDVAALVPSVEALRAAGVNKIIALTHVGLPRDLEAIATIPGIDIVVGGHSHTLLHNHDPRAAGPYPLWVDNPGGHRTAIVQAGAYSRYLGDLTVTFDDAGNVIAASGDPLLLDASFVPDAAVLARIAELSGPIEQVKAEPIAVAAAPIDGRREACRVRECEMGNLVADAVLARFASQGVQIVIQNGGGLRASLDAGEITLGGILEVLPFQNTVATFQLKGSEVIAALEGGVAGIEQGAGRFPQVAGIRYAIDPSRPPEAGRIASVEVRQADGWTPIDPDRTYGVAANNFLRGGGDGYLVFRDNATNAYDHGPNLEDVVAAYLADHQPYRPSLDGRIAFVPPAAPAPPPADPAPPPVEEAARTHLVKQGDNLWDLARQYYGDGSQWRRIVAANPGLGTRSLRLGSELVIPQP